MFNSKMLPLFKSELTQAGEEKAKAITVWQNTQPDSDAWSSGPVKGGDHSDTHLSHVHVTANHIERMVLGWVIRPCLLTLY